MNWNINIGSLEKLLQSNVDIEFVERKGIGHPDTICDIAAEQVSISLCKYYLEEFGTIMHHNVDKALLIGGISKASYNGGEVIEPIELIIAGRAIKEKGGKSLPVDEIAVETIHNYLSRTIKNLDVQNHIKINVKIRPGSKDLIELFERFGKGQEPLSNDTSIGTGFYPLNKIEKAVYKTEEFLNSDGIKKVYPFIGEDIKVMGVREKNKIKLTIAMATVDKYIDSLKDYISKITTVRELLFDQPWISSDYEISLNTADSYEDESIYLTVTGTSAEHGDDGEVGRGNRANGLITPNRPMTLEAVAGKNPVSHVGKIYNIFANDLSKAIVERGYASEAYVYIVSQIGKPISQPQILDIQTKGQTVEKKLIRNAAEEMLKSLPMFWKKIVEEEYKVA